MLILYGFPKKGIRMLDQGTLYVCATPIGNLADITLRVLDTLRQVDLIAAEDTRHSRKLLQHYEIYTPLTSYHEHNEKGKSRELLQKLKSGQSIALISDAGLPGISDPGGELIRLCQAENVKLDVLPGPNAALTALLLSGMPTDHFAFLGFLPANKGERRRKLEAYAQLPLTRIFYEAPHRLLATLEDLAEIYGECQGAVVREITKIHQSVHKGILPALVQEFKETPARGECCLVLEPYVAPVLAGTPEVWRQEVEEGMAHGLSKQDAMKEVAKRYAVSKREIYRIMLEGNS